MSVSPAACRTSAGATTSRISIRAAARPRRVMTFSTSTDPSASAQSTSQSPRNANGSSGRSIRRSKSTRSSALRTRRVSPLPDDQHELPVESGELRERRIALDRRTADLPVERLVSLRPRGRRRSAAPSPRPFFHGIARYSALRRILTRPAPTARASERREQLRLLRLRLLQVASLTWP